MKSKVLMVAAAAALVMLMSTVLAQGAVIYSENFDGVGVTPGQSLRDAPFNWWEVAPHWRSPMWVLLNSGSWGFTGNYIDGETSNNGGGNDGYARLGTDLSVAAGTTFLTFGFNMYADSPGGDPIFGNNVTIGDKTNIPHRIGWSINSGIISFSADGGTTNWTAGGSAYHNVMLTTHIYADFVAQKVWADISKDGGATYTTSPQYQLDLPANQFNYFGMTWDRRGTVRSFMADNIVVEVVPEPGALFALGSGLIGLAGFAIRRRR